MPGGATAFLCAPLCPWWLKRNTLNDRGHEGTRRAPILPSWFGHNCEKSVGIGVVSEGPAQVGEQIAVAGGEDEAGAELEGIRSELVLVVAGRLGSRSCAGIVRTQKMEQVGRFQPGGPVGFAVGIDQQRECDSSLFAEKTGVVHIAESDGRQVDSGSLELWFVGAQLRDMLAAEDSTVVAKKDDHRRLFLPERAEANVMACRLRQHDVR